MATPALTSEPVSVPVAKTDPAVCYHCGSETGGRPVLYAGHAFCCEGCSAVYSILSQNQLCNYYDLNAHPGTSQKVKPRPEYAFLEDPEVSASLLEFSDGKIAKVNFSLPNIHCSSCIWLLEQLFRLKPGIRRSEVNFRRKEVYITFETGTVTLREIAELLHSLGYVPDLSMDRAGGKKGTEHPNRNLWIRIGIAGFCFGNIMLLSFPEYLSLNDPAFARLFGWLSIAISLPATFYAGSGYFQSAWNGICNRIINMDVPIATGMLVIFIRSVYEIISGTGSGYLDSLCGLVFFLLLGKIFQARTFDLLSFDRDYRSYFPLGVMRRTGQREVSVPVTSLSKGDHIIVRNAELVPADSILVSGESAIDYSFVTGESERVPRKRGELIYAGGRHYGSAVELEVVKEVSQSYLTRLWNHDSFRKQEEGEVTRISNRIGRNFTVAVLFISLFASLWWWYSDPSMILKVVSSVLIVACPCALALSVPFTMGSVLAIFGKRGFYLKGPAVVEQLAEADTLVFDKTGTLTRPGLSGIRWEGETLSESDTHAIRSLLRHSTHPLSVSLYRHLTGPDDLHWDAFDELPSKGIRGTRAGTEWKAGSRTFAGKEEDSVAQQEQQGSSVWISENGNVKGRFVLESALREGMPELLKDLGATYSLSLLSGDNEKDEHTFRGLFPSKAPMLFHQTPHSKLDYIRLLQEKGGKVIMVGDGLNDAGALRQSDAGISIAEDVSSFTPASDAILAAGSVDTLPRFLDFSQRAMRIIRSSFYVSFLYNAVGISFAVSGHLSPLVAAILMPLSSVSVVLFTTLSVRLAAYRRGLAGSAYPSNR